MVGDPAGGLEELLLLVEDEEVVAGSADAAELVLLEGQRVLLTRALGAHHLQKSGNHVIGKVYNIKKRLCHQAKKVKPKNVQK